MNPWEEKFVTVVMRIYFKGPRSDQRQFLTIESPLKTMKNAFYFMFSFHAFRYFDIYIFALTFWL